jgi:hypothetical protein
MRPRHKRPRKHEFTLKVKGESEISPWRPIIFRGSLAAVERWGETVRSWPPNQYMHLRLHSSPEHEPWGAGLHCSDISVLGTLISEVVDSEI